MHIPIGMPRQETVTTATVRFAPYYKLGRKDEVPSWLTMVVNESQCLIADDDDVQPMIRIYRCIFVSFANSGQQCEKNVSINFLWWS
jgi:hypothetical protein